MPIRGAYFQQSHEVMEPRCVLPSLRTIAAPADCTRPQAGGGRNRYVRIKVRRKLLYVSSAEVQRNAAPPHNPVRRSMRYVTGLRGCSHAAQNSKPRLSAAANKSCLKGRTFKIWSCCPAPYGKGTHVCAASTGRVLQPAPGAAVVMMRQRRNFGTAAPFFDNKPIFIYTRLDGRDPQNRQPGNQKHKIPRGSNSTGGGTAVTSPTSRTGGTELRLFHSWDLSVSRPTNRQVQSGPRRIKALRPAGFAARGALAHTPRPFLRPIDQTNYMNLPGALGTRPGYGAAFPSVPFSVMMLRHFYLHAGPKPPHFSDPECKNLYHHVKKNARRL